VNRRDFLDSVLKAGIGSAFLPAALTYARKWRKTGELYTINPEWVDAPLEVQFMWHLNMIGIMDQNYKPTPVLVSRSSKQILSHINKEDKILTHSEYPIRLSSDLVYIPPHAS